MKNQKSQKIIVIGIAGGAGSGKSTLAALLKDHFKDQAQLIAMDSYFLDFGHITDLNELDITNFDTPDAFHMSELVSDIKALHEDSSVNIPIYDFPQSRRVSSVQIFAKPYLIVEGLFVLQNPEIGKLLDYKIFVDATEEARTTRQVERAAERGHRLDDFKKRLRRFTMPMHKKLIEPTRKDADLIIENSKNDLQVLHTAVEKITAELAKKC